MRRLLVFGFALSFLLSACGGGNSTETGLEAHEAWTHPAAQGENTAVYFALHNHSSKADILTGASTDATEAVAIQENTTSQFNLFR